MSTTTRRRSARGQAAIELSLLGIVLVPIVLYVIFIDDLLRYKQDQQEGMVTTGWDFSTMNYDHQSSGSYPYVNNLQNVIQTYNRYAFGDHTMAEPAFYDQNSNKEHHHLGVGAHQCWLVGGKQNQITCTRIDGNAATNYFPDLAGNAQQRLRGQVMGGNQGGLYSCKGKVGVINHWLPSGNMFFTKVELSSRSYHGWNSAQKIGADGAGMHNVGFAAGDDSKTDSYHFPVDTYGMITHPFAMANHDDFNNYPKSFTHSGPLYARVNAIYGAPLAKAAIVAGALYGVQAVARQLLNPLCLLDGPAGDLLITPEVSFTSGYDPRINGFYSSQYWDFSSNHVSKNYQQRGKFYLGAKSKP